MRYCVDSYVSSLSWNNSNSLLSDDQAMFPSTGKPSEMLGEIKCGRQMSVAPEGTEEETVRPLLEGVGKINLPVENTYRMTDPVFGVSEAIGMEVKKESLSVFEPWR